MNRDLGRFARLQFVLFELGPGALARGIAGAKGEFPPAAVREEQRPVVRVGDQEVLHGILLARDVADDPLAAAALDPVLVDGRALAEERREALAVVIGLGGRDHPRTLELQLAVQQPQHGIVQVLLGDGKGPRGPCRQLADDLVRRRSKEIRDRIGVILAVHFTLSRISTL